MLTPEPPGNSRIVSLRELHCFVEGAKVEPSLGLGECVHGVCAYVCLVAQSCPTLLRPCGLQPTRLLCPWDFPGKTTRVVLSFSRESSQAKNQTHSPALIGRFFTTEPPGDPAQDPARSNLVLIQMLRSIGLAKKLAEVFRKMVWTNLNELFGQPNIT